MTPTDDDRRAHPRVGTGDGSGWDVELHTYDRDGGRIDLRGTVCSLSRSGVLVRVRDELEIGTGCLIHFLRTGTLVAPAYAIGKIVRVEPMDDGMDVAVHFEKPLDRVSAPD